MIIFLPSFIYGTNNDQQTKLSWIYDYVIYNDP